MSGIELDLIFDILDPFGNDDTQRAQLWREIWYHGAISRAEAEALLIRDGDFLVRESQGSSGQYVLTGMQHNTKKHLLLIDPEGAVSIYNSACILLRTSVPSHKITTTVWNLHANGRDSLPTCENDEVSNFGNLRNLHLIHGNSYMVLHWSSGRSWRREKPINFRLTLFP